MSDAVGRIRRATLSSKWLVRWAEQKVKDGMPAERAWQEAAMECRTLPPPEWLALARAVFLAEHGRTTG